MANPIDQVDAFDLAAPARYDAANYDYLLKAQAESDIISEITGGAVATVADFGVSVWNSLPGTEPIETMSVLQRFSENAANVYAEHPDTIKTASLIGGMFVPGGAALKGLNLARAGMKSANFFSNVGREQALTRLGELKKLGAAANEEYKAARNAFYARGVANQVVDAAGMELLIASTMNAHPLMEDYFEDPVYHIGTSLLLGGAIGGGLGFIADRAALRGISGAVESQAAEMALSGYVDIHPALPNATKIQVRQDNIKGLEEILKRGAAATKDGPAILNPLAKDFTEKMLLEERAAQVADFQDMASNLIKNTPKEFQDDLMLRLANDPRFVGTDAVTLLRFAESKQGAKKFNKDAVSEEAPPLFKEQEIKKGPNAGEKREVAVSVAYNPEFNLFGPIPNMVDISRANALKGVTAESVTKHSSISREAIQIPNYDASLELASATSPVIDKMYLERLTYVDQLDQARLAKAVVDPDDLPMINGIIARAAKEGEREALAGLKVKLTKLEPQYSAAETAKVLKANGVRADYEQKALELLAPGQNLSRFDLLKQLPAFSDEWTMLKEWRAGNGVAKMRLAADSFFRGGYGAAGNAEAFRKIYDSTASKLLRAEFRKLADAEGNVYLWRGMTKEPRGQATLESYSTDYKKAAEFGTPRLFKVKVDEIVGAIADLTSNDGLRKNEIIVASSTRVPEASIPIAGKNVPLSSLNTTTKGVEELSMPQLVQHLVNKKEESILSLLAAGRSFEEIAIKTNTPVNTVKAWVLDGKPQGQLSLYGSFVEYGDAAQVANYMSLSKAPIMVRANQHQGQYAKMQASADKVALDRAAKVIMEGIVQTSRSSIAKEVGKLFFGKDNQEILHLLRKAVTEAVPDKAGSKFFQSSDFYGRRMKDIGPLASVIGNQVQGVANRMLDKLLREPSLHLGRISKSVPALSELNTAVALNAGLKGPRFYENRQFWQKEKVLNLEGKYEEKLVPVEFRGQPFKVVSDDVDNFLRSVAPVGRELYELAATKASAVGRPPMPDIGFWLPAINPRNKHIAYVHDLVTGTTRTLWGNSADELEAAISAFKPTVLDKLADGTIKIIKKGDQEAENLLLGRTDVMDMTIADIGKYHSGASAPAIVKANADVMGEIVGGLEHYVQASVRDMASVIMYDVMDSLDSLSKINRRNAAGQPLGPIAKFLHKPNDPAAVLKNTLLGVSDLKEYEPWQWMNQGFEGVVGYALTKASKAWDAAVSQLPSFKIFKKSGNPTDLQGMDYKAFSEALAKEGIVNPYADYEDAVAEQLFGVAKLTEAKNLSSRLVYASNALAATAALRFGEIAQPLVNAMSLPILMMSAVAAKQPASFLGAKLATKEVGLMEVMMDGVRAMNSKEFERWGKKWEEAGDYASLVSEATKVLRLPREFEPGALAKMERAVESNLVQIMSKPSDFSEGMVRKVSMFTGAMLAKKLYPELNDAGVTIFARHFRDRVIGNYNAAQRPVFFQGTLGAAAGLFQTYMVTMAQSIYGHLELRDYKALAKMMLTQQTIFGMSSLPGFDMVSEYIGEHFSDEHVDLQSGTFRALPDELAKSVLYGLPSALGPAFYSRGELAPRVPNLATGIVNLPSVSMAGQAAQTIGAVVEALGQTGEDIPRHIGQALSLQSVSRPLARISELATGYSMTGPGNTVATPAEVWTTTSVLSRVIGTRPLTESVLRDTRHLESVYKSIDTENRREAVNKLRTAIRGGTLDDAKLADIAEEYMKYGSPTGWRAAVREALGTTTEPLSAPMRKRLGPDHPLNFMIDGLDDQ
jgi:hypothetical protein